MTNNLMADDDWVPAACTLPTAEQPLRRAEFDDLFAEDLVSVNEVSPLDVMPSQVVQPGDGCGSPDC